MKQGWTSTAYMGAGTEIAPFLRTARLDQRFSYLLYLPKGFRTNSPERPRLLAAIHDTYRDMYSLRHHFKTFADQTNTAVLLPVFPTGVTDREELHSYKFMFVQGIRFDLILKDMVDEVRETFDFKSELLLYGFSGGAQFAHRYLYLHPENICSAVIVSPGRITYLDPEEDYYCGIRNFEAVFGKKVDLSALRKTKILLMVGSNDTEVIDYAAEGDTAPAIEKFGKNRLERVRALYQNYLDYGLKVQMKELPNISHEADKAIPLAAEFFAQRL